MIKEVYGSLELIVNICVLRKMRIAALISKENLLFSFFSKSTFCSLVTLRVRSSILLFSRKGEGSFCATEKRIFCYLLVHTPAHHA